MYLNKNVKNEIFEDKEEFDEFKVPFFNVVQDCDKQLLIQQNEKLKLNVNIRVFSHKIIDRMYSNDDEMKVKLMLIHSSINEALLQQTKSLINSNINSYNTSLHESIRSSIV